MGKRKVLHPNRTILIFVVIGYSAFLVLMILMDWYLIRDSRIEMMRAEQRALRDYINKVQDSMDRIDRQLSEVYIQDENFQALRYRQDSVMEYSCAYDLWDTLNWRMAVDESLSGFYIYYGGKQIPWYRVNTDIIDSYISQEINEQLEGRLSSGTIGRAWTSVAVEENNYLVVNFERENIAVVGVYSLQNIDKVIRESMNKDVEVMLIGEGKIQKNEALAAQLGLAEQVVRYADSFSSVIEGYQVYGHRIPNMDLWICVAYPLRFLELINVQQMTLLVLTAVSLFAIVLLMRFMQSEVMGPMRRLTDVMNTIRTGGAQEIPSLECRFYEIREVNETLSAMVRELKEQRILTYEETIQKNQAKMQYLQLQLKPHFYLNGLKLLNVLAMEQQTDQMQELIMDLSGHIRYLLQNEREIVPLSMELDFVRNYVDLQKHMSDRLVNCEITADDEVMDWMVPTLIVQTFVENSVKYARVGRSGTHLQIRITASCLPTEDGNYLDIIVQDNGHGYPEEILQEINGAILEGNISVGINNIKRRCLFLYGDKVEYSFSNYEGALSELIIPERRSENEYPVS